MVAEEEQATAAPAGTAAKMAEGQVGDRRGRPRRGTCCCCLWRPRPYSGAAGRSGGGMRPGRAARRIRRTSTGAAKLRT